MSTDDEPVINFCEWCTYKGIRCCLKTKDTNKFCNKHTIIKNDFKLTPKVEGQEILTCSTHREIKFTPRSRDQIKTIMKKYNCDTDFVEIVFPGGIVEGGDICDDCYIALDSDQTKFYYKPTEKGDKSIGSMKIKLIDYCSKESVILFNEDYYCKDCYVNAGKKKGYPTLKTLENK